MYLQNRPEAARRKSAGAVEPIDHGHLPRRTAEIQGPSVETGHLDTELAPVARFRQGDMPHVELQVEVLILDPARTVQPERYHHELAPERRSAGEAGLHLAENLIE